MIRVALTAAVLASSLTLAPAKDEKPKPTATDFAVLPKFVEAVAKADEVTLYEGLPHQTMEAKLLKSELAEKKTVTLHDFPFYAEPLALKMGDKTKLNTVVALEGMYRKFGGEKKCGGFHPDYAVEFTVGKDKYHALICFGCHEVKLYGPKLELRADMSEGGNESFAELLKGYRKNRPAAKE